MPEAWQHAVDIFARLVTISSTDGRLVRGRDRTASSGCSHQRADVAESLFVLPILIGAIDILITELIYLYWVSCAARASPARCRQRWSSGWRRP